MRIGRFKPRHPTGFFRLCYRSAFNWQMFANISIHLFSIFPHLNWFGRRVSRRQTRLDCSLHKRYQPAIRLILSSIRVGSFCRLSRRSRRTRGIVWERRVIGLGKCRCRSRLQGNSACTLSFTFCSWELLLPRRSILVERSRRRIHRRRPCSRPIWD